MIGSKPQFKFDNPTKLNPTFEQAHADYLKTRSGDFNMNNQAFLRAILAGVVALDKEKPTALRALIKRGIDAAGEIAVPPPPPPASVKKVAAPTSATPPPRGKGGAVVVPQEPKKGRHLAVVPDPPAKKPTKPGTQVPTQQPTPVTKTGRGRPPK